MSSEQDELVADGIAERTLEMPGPAGLQSDLGLSNTQYSIALTVTYVPYIAAELPLTLAMKAM